MKLGQAGGPHKSRRRDGDDLGAGNSGIDNPGTDSPGTDEDVWQYATRDITPLIGRNDRIHTRRKQANQAKIHATAGSNHPGDPPTDAQVGTGNRAPPETESQPDKTGSMPPLGIGGTAGLDRRTATRLRRGQLNIDATLDLHGHQRRAAQAALGDFIIGAAHSGHRCVRVITGKGQPGPVEDGWRGRGVLRAGLIDWLNAPDIRPFILACHPAQPRDGGGGAFYILLHRRKIRDARE